MFRLDFPEDSFCPPEFLSTPGRVAAPSVAVSIGGALSHCPQSFLASHEAVALLGARCSWHRRQKARQMHWAGFAPRLADTCRHSNHWDNAATSLLFSETANVLDILLTCPSTHFIISEVQTAMKSLGYHHYFASRLRRQAFFDIFPTRYSTHFMTVSRVRATFR